MNFKYKCILQKFFSNIPHGELANYLFQKYVTRSLPPRNKKFLIKVNNGLRHYKNFKEYNRLKTEGRKYYEFGAGWTLTIPLAMSFLNFEVFCIDIRKLIIPDLIHDSVEKFKFNEEILPFRSDSIKKEATLNGDVVGWLKDNYRINYYAPKDARATGFEDNSFDFISSTTTLEHIPKDDILSILQECYRIINKGGILSMTIDYQDHWSYFDKKISVYNFLKFSSKEWKKYNPSLHFQNRLRHSDYMKLINKTDFKILKETPQFPDEGDIKVLKAINLSGEFRNYGFDDIAIRGSEIVLMK